MMKESAVFYPGEAIEDNTIYRGEIVEAGSRIHAGYTPGQPAYLHIRANATKIRQTPLAGGPTWASSYFVYTVEAKLITSYVCHHSMAPWTTTDFVTDEINISLGLMPKTPISGYVELWAGGSPDVLLDTKDFSIPVSGAPEKFPWKWVAIGGGVTAAIIGVILASRRSK